MSPKVTLSLKNPPTVSGLDSKYFDKSNSKLTIPLVLIEETGWGFLSC